MSYEGRGAEFWSQIDPSKCKVRRWFVHTAVCGFPFGNCGEAGYSSLALPDGEEMVFEQWGNYSSSYATEYDCPGTPLGREAEAFVKSHGEKIPIETGPSPHDGDWDKEWECDFCGTILPLGEMVLNEGVREVYCTSVCEELRWGHWIPSILRGEIPDGGREVFLSAYCWMADEISAKGMRVVELMIKNATTGDLLPPGEVEELKQLCGEQFSLMVEASCALFLTEKRAGVIQEARNRGFLEGHPIQMS